MNPTATAKPQVPRLSQLTDLLWTGGALPVRHDAATRVITHWAELGIRAVVDTRAEWTDEDLVAAVVPEIEYLNPGVVDGGQPMPDSWFEAITTFTARHHALRHGVLVHCHSGVNRGPSGAFTVLLTQGWDPVDAIERIRSTYPVANVSYAENAIDWWHRTSDMPAPLRHEQHRRFAVWRQADRSARAVVHRRKPERRSARDRAARRPR